MKEYSKEFTSSIYVLKIRKIKPQVMMMMMNQVRLLSVVEWQVRRPGAVAQPVVAFQSWLPIGCHQPAARPPKPTCLPLTDSRPLMAIICRHYRAAGAAEADTGRPAGAPLTDCAANDIPSALPRTLYSGQKNRLCFGLVAISAFYVVSYVVFLQRVSLL